MFCPRSLKFNPDGPNTACQRPHYCSCGARSHRSVSSYKQNRKSDLRRFTILNAQVLLSLPRFLRSTAIVAMNPKGGHNWAAGPSSSRDICKSGGPPLIPVARLLPSSRPNLSRETTQFQPDNNRLRRIIGSGNAWLNQLVGMVRTIDGRYPLGTLRRD